jgi:hypothetical protein
MRHSTFTFTNSPFPKDSIALGTLIPQKQNPHLNAKDNHDVGDDDIISSVDEQFDAYLHTGSDTSFSAMLSKIFNFGTNSTSQESHRFQSREAKLYFLRKPDEMFQKLCAKENIQRFLEQEQENEQNTYFITAYRTLTDACLLDESSQGRRAHLQAEVPTGALAGVDPIGVTNVSASGKFERVEDSSQNMICRDERIYAVCCQKVKLKTVKGQFEKVRLDRKSVWTSYEKKRAGSTLTVASIRGEGNETNDDDEEDEDEEYVMARWDVGEGLAFEVMQE